MVKICCIGAGHVGGPTMAVIALKCPEIEVAVVDVSASRIAAWNSDNLPIYEPGLDQIVTQCKANNNLLFSTDVNRHVAEADIVFISVNTPTKTAGRGTGRATDLANWESAARTIAKVSTSDKIVVEKSTVPVRTADAVEMILSYRSGARFQVVSNPGFLAEGTAVCDLLEPDRVLLGGRDTPAGREAVRALRDIYSRWVPQERILTAGLLSAELSKLAANAFLAQRISSVNALSALCEATGADVGQVVHAVGRDYRVGPWFLEPGVGFGGPRLRKDVLSLVYICECMGLGEVAEYWRRVVEVNEYQKSRFVRRVVSSMFGTVWGKKMAVLGLAFKKDTEDTRESPALDICRGLMDDGARLSVYDPRVSGEQIKRDLAVVDDQVSVAHDAYEATREAHGICILTEWDEFKSVDYKRVFETMKKPAFLFDGRNVVDVDSLRDIGFIVYSVGKPL